MQGQAEFILQACDGLADAIERQDAIKTEALCADYTRAIGQFGHESGQIDTLVLGCTHYPFAISELRALIGPQVQLIDSGTPVARQTQRLLKTHNALSANATPPSLQLYATGHPERLQAAASHWLQLTQPVHMLSI